MDLHAPQSPFHELTSLENRYHRTLSCFGQLDKPIWTDMLGHIQLQKESISRDKHNSRSFCQCLTSKCDVTYRYYTFHAGVSKYFELRV